MMAALGLVAGALAKRNAGSETAHLADFPAGETRGATAEVVQNWLGNVRSQVEGILRPRTVTELQELIAQEKGRLLVMGRRMSKTALLAARKGRALDMSGLEGIVEFGDDYVVAQGGITLYALSRALYQRGRQLPGFTITANPSIGGMITAPTKGSNHPFTRFANSVSSAVQWVKVVRPSGELAVLRAGEQDRELALLKDSYSAVGVVAEARLRTIPLVSAEVREVVVATLRRFMEDGQEKARALENRTFLFPKLDLAVVRVHSDVRRATPTAPFESLLVGPNTPYVKLANNLPRFGRSAILSAALRLGADTSGRRKLHIENLTPYPVDGSGYLDFITWSLPIGRFDAVLPRIVEFCRSHPSFPAECLVEIFRMFPEVRFLDPDERVALDPVAFDRRESARWEAFYRDYNRLMVDLGASPFLNQTRYIGPDDLRRVYGARYDAWREAILAVDPGRKLGSVYLDHVLGFRAGS
jgi:FAD/FMN-containing dehydrogenase